MEKSKSWQEMSNTFEKRHVYALLYILLSVILEHEPQSPLTPGMSNKQPDTKRPPPAFSCIVHTFLHPFIII